MGNDEGSPPKDGAKLKFSSSEISNSLSGLAGGIAGYFNPFSSNGIGAQLSQTDTLYFNLRNYLISNNRTLLSQVYVENGIVQVLVDQPVDDAYSKGVEIKSSELDADDIEKLKNFMERERVFYALTQAAKWARLFGGGSVLIITDQPPDEPLDWDKIDENSPIEFRATDMWELYNQGWTGTEDRKAEIQEDGNLEEYPVNYVYYGIKIHPSRILRIKGKEAPSFVRQTLRGWGMSELERVIRSLNQYLKNQDLIFELLDEGKLDIYRIEGFNTSLISEGGTSAAQSRIQSANMIKNFLNALVMDKDDEYEQKQISFSGLGDILTQIRQGLAADLRMPMTKLFGISAAGFNSGEDDIENYNAMIESEIRNKTKFIALDLVRLCCKKLFGLDPDDLQITFPSLRVLGAKEEEEVKDSQFNRTIAAWQAGLAEDEEAKESINRGSLLPVEIDETTPAAERGLDDEEGKPDFRTRNDKVDK